MDKIAEDRCNLAFYGSGEVTFEKHHINQPPTEYIHNFLTTCCHKFFKRLGPYDDKQLSQVGILQAQEIGYRAMVF